MLQPKQSFTIESSDRFLVFWIKNLDHLAEQRKVLYGNWERVGTDADEVSHEGICKEVKTMIKLSKSEKRHD